MNHDSHGHGYDDGTYPDERPRRRRQGIGPAATMGLVVVAAFVALGFTGAAFAVSTYRSLAADLPDPSLLERIELPQRSVVYDRTGTVELARFGEFNRETVSFDEIAPVLVDATTAIEDRTFWDNSGFDPLGIVAATSENSDSGQSSLGNLWYVTQAMRCFCHMRRKKDGL